MRLKPAYIAFFCSVAFLAALLSAPAMAEESSELNSAFNLNDNDSIETSHFPRVASKIAENVTVITADDIARLNAHTLSEVLQTVPGIQLDYLRTPGTFTFFNIQGALNTTVLVLIDGIRQNDFSQNIALPGLIPVQQIDRIEIIKGASSAAWGSALGGVINIITKSPDSERTAAGMLSGSVGSKLTADTRAELSGTIKDFGYYLTLGYLHSDGLAANNGNNQSNLYSKFSYRLPSDGTISLGLSNQSNRPGLDEGNIPLGPDAAGTPQFLFVHDNAQNRRTSGFLRLSQPLGPRFSLDIDGYLTSYDNHTKWGGLDQNGTITFTNDNNLLESSHGADARLVWGDSRQNIATGVEYSHAHTRIADLLSDAPPVSDRTFDRYGLYANGAFSIGALTILPGVREDFTGVTGNNLSYTLGATYQFADTTVLRAYAAKGFSLPLAFKQNELQIIRTVQSGIESSAVPYLWLKGTYFYNTVRNSESVGSDPTVTNQDRQGFEIESRTVPFAGFSLNTGYTFVYVTDADTGARLKTSSQQSIPPHNVKLALNYDNAGLGLRGALTGNYIWWNGAGTPVADQGMVWDLHLTWKVVPASELSPELFFSGRNLFNGNQTTYTILYPTAPRWFEGGVRYRF